jgi:hypothetical protein
MEQKNTTDHDQSDIAVLLAAFERLGVDDKAKAVQHILKERGADGKNIPDVGETAITTKRLLTITHSCHICRQFRISREPKDNFPDYVRSKHIPLSKEYLQQGLNKQCVLFEWIFTILSHGLNGFKIDLAKWAALWSNDSSRDPADILQLVSAGSISTVFFGAGSQDSVSLQVIYRADPYLVDELWNVATDMRERSSYELFSNSYDKKITTKFRMSADAGMFKLVVQYSTVRQHRVGAISAIRLGP